MTRPDSTDAFVRGYDAFARPWFTPLAHSIADQVELERRNAPQYCVMVGINGSQGSGKSTLANWLAAELRQHHRLRVAVMSIDDFYLSSVKRQALANQVHPLLRTRGVPGTHDTERIKHVLSAFRSHRVPLTVPRFDKATDNPLPKNLWTVFDSPVDVVLFEGWCWGVPPQNKESLRTPVNALEAEFDKDATWREFVNDQVKTVYAPLYAFMDRWVMLKAPSFNAVFDWRMEQEQALAHSQPDGALPLLDPVHLKRFIEHFQRLTEHSLCTLSPHCDDVFIMDNKRNILSHVRSES